MNFKDIRKLLKKSERWMGEKFRVEQIRRIQKTGEHKDREEMKKRFINEVTLLYIHLFEDLTKREYRECLLEILSQEMRGIRD